MTRLIHTESTYLLCHFFIDDQRLPRDTPGPKITDPEDNVGTIQDWLYREQRTWTDKRDFTRNATATTFYFSGRMRNEVIFRRQPHTKQIRDKLNYVRWCPQAHIAQLRLPYKRAKYSYTNRVTRNCKW